MTNADPAAGEAAWKRRAAALLLVAYGAFLVAAQSRLTVFEDEASIVFIAAAQSPAQTAGIFLHGGGQHEHPPLYDLILHAWLQVTRGDLAFVRLPSIAFYCVGLWLLGATANLLWGRRLAALLIAVAWPGGYLFGTPAHWSAFAFLGLSGMTYWYVRWRRSERWRDLAGFSAFTIALVFTNYLGIAFAAMLGLHFALGRPGRRLLGQAAVHAAVVAVAYVPILRAFLGVVGGRVSQPRSASRAVGEIVYYAYSLAPTEAVAPWHWPAAGVALGLLLLGFAALRTRGPHWILALLASVYLAAGLVGALNGRYLGLYGPWLLLYLTGLLTFTRMKRTVVTALACVFGLGWIGLGTGSWLATFRYAEPWDEITRQILQATAPGDLVVCDHASFYFYAHRQERWSDWSRPTATEPIERAGRRFTALESWRAAIPGRRGVVHVRSAATEPEEASRLEDYLERHYRLVDAQRYIRDEASPLKSRFIRGQPGWRVEVLRYEARAPEEGARLSTRRIPAS